MGWIRGALTIAKAAKAKWLPFVVIFTVTAIGGAMYWSYQKGVHVTERKWSAKMASALERQMKEMSRVKDADLKTVVKIVEMEREIEDTVDAILLPDIGDACAERVYRWVRQFDSTILSVNRHAGGVD
jgi:hypothetical protein